MRSLLSLLGDAARRSALQVTLESGQPVVYTTARGAEAESTVLPPSDLFEMIVAAVDDAQQVELAVGNPVEFTIDAGAKWTVCAEPGMDGITVRARRGGADRERLDIDVDYSSVGAAGPGVSERREPLEPVAPGVSANPVFEAPPSRRAGEPSGSTRAPLSVEALDVPTLDDPGDSGVDFGVGGPAPAAFESGTWTLAGDDEFGADSLGELGGDDEFGGGLSEDSLPAGFAELPSPAREGYIGVPDDDDDDAGFEPFSEPAPKSSVDRRHTLSPTVRAMSASPVPAASPGPLDRSGSGSGSGSGTQRDLAGLTAGAAAAASAAQASTRREMTAMRSPEAETLRELATFGHGQAELNDVVADIGEGALVYVREPGFIDTLAQVFLSPSITIDDTNDPLEVWSRVRGLPAGTILIVRCEDPSRLLDWILRRLEEGFRVFVETRAKTPEGARRVLLGVGATLRAEQWLDSQLTFTFIPGDDGPHLVTLEHD